MDLVNVSDNYFTERQHQFILTYCENCSYKYGEVDNEGTPPTGLIHEIPPTEEIYPLIERRIEQSMGPDANKYSLYRMYVNCFAPGENPYFHKDGRGITFLYYANMEWDLQNGGETQFYIDGNILGVPPIPNRLVVFDGMIQHRATSFRNKHRFSVAIKYGYEETPPE